MYQENSEGTTYRFKKMLTDLNIQSVKSFSDRSRKTSVKDIHALRHTFCYLHGFQGTPIVTLQSIVGHMSSKMTEAYTLHTTEQSKRDAIQRFSLGEIVPSSLTHTKNILIQKITECHDEELLKQLLSDITPKISTQDYIEKNEPPQRGMKW